MEEILKDINRRCVALADDEQKRNNLILHDVVDIIINELKKVKLFKSLYREKFYGGSFYDGLKVGSSTEFDIDLLLILPKNSNPKVEASDKPGFVHVSASPVFTDIGENYKGLDSLIDKNTNQISARKTLSWMEGLLRKALTQLCPNGNQLCTKPIGGKAYTIYLRDRKSGPAFTINISAKAQNEPEIKIDVDLVPCFMFESNYWPSKAKGYRQWDARNHGNKSTFLAVPKLPTDLGNPDFYWRLSFQEQERALISGDLGRLKPTLRLIKKLRDKWDHKKISSYYIKTIFLWELEKRDRSFWNKPLFEVYFEMLKIYRDRLANRDIQYYWNSKYNLIGHINKTTLDDFSNRIKRIIGDIERLGGTDPFIVAKSLVSVEELELLKKELFKTEVFHKKYNGMERTIHEILRDKINNDKFKYDIKDCHGIIYSVIQKLFREMRQLDPIIKKANIFHGASYYCGTEIAVPDKVGIYFLMNLPVERIIMSDENNQGYFSIQLRNFDKKTLGKSRWKKFRNLEQFLDGTIISPRKVQNWFEMIVVEALESTHFGANFRMVGVTSSKTEPSIMLHAIVNKKEIEIGLIPSFKINVSEWCEIFPLQVDNGIMKTDFFMIPSPQGDEYLDELWSPSFQLQEKIIMHDEHFMKPCFKILKVIKNELNHTSIKNYFLKSVVMHMLKENPEIFRKHSRSFVLMQVLKCYDKCLAFNELPYYWNQEINLLDDIPKEERQIISTSISRLVTEIDENIHNHPEKILKEIFHLKKM